MTPPSFLDTSLGRRIAYHRHDGTSDLPGIVFLGGFKSDMQGTKALWLQDWARAHGRDFLRFDYSGHGESSGRFEDGAIGDWAQDAGAVISELTRGPQILAGSSMGGWIALLCARAMPDRVAGLVGIAAAPDFTEDSMWAGFDADQRDALMDKGRIELPSDYDDGPYVITRRLIEEGRNNLILRTPLKLPFPVRLMQGTEDEAVTRDTALRLLDHASGDDIRLTFVKGADHRFSDPACLRMIGHAIHSVTKAAESGRG